MEMRFVWLIILLSPLLSGGCTTFSAPDPRETVMITDPFTGAPRPVRNSRLGVSLTDEARFLVGGGTEEIVTPGEESVIRSGGVR